MLSEMITIIIEYPILFFVDIAKIKLTNIKSMTIDKENPIEYLITPQNIDMTIYINIKVNWLKRVNLFWFTSFNDVYILKSTIKHNFMI